MARWPRAPRHERVCPQSAGARPLVQPGSPRGERHRLPKKPVDRCRRDHIPRSDQLLERLRLRARCLRARRLLGRPRLRRLVPPRRPGRRSEPGRLVELRWSPRRASPFRRPRADGCSARPRVSRSRLPRVVRLGPRRREGAVRLSPDEAVQAPAREVRRVSEAAVAVAVVPVVRPEGSVARAGVAREAVSAAEGACAVAGCLRRPAVVAGPSVVGAGRPSAAARAVGAATPRSSSRPSSPSTRPRTLLCPSTRSSSSEG